MCDYRFTTPVAFLIFNRPDTTERVFSEIAKAKPPKLLVVGDGPRPTLPDEEERVAATRAIIDRVDWNCEVLTNYSDVNLGCKSRVSTGVNWVFDQVSEAVILEDDCLPHPSFFRFCQELLERYRDDQRISMISGNNLQLGVRRNGDSYYFSKFTHIWGWGTWRDRWTRSYDVEMRYWPYMRDEGWIVDLVPDPAERRYWVTIFDSVHRGELDTWDYQWTLACWLNSRLTILPSVNLVSNIGFGPGATHTVDSGVYSDLPACEMAFPLKHPVGVVRNVLLDRNTERKCRRPGLMRRIGRRLVGSW